MLFGKQACDPREQFQRKGGWGSVLAIALAVIAKLPGNGALVWGAAPKLYFGPKASIRKTVAHDRRFQAFDRQR